MDIDVIRIAQTAGEARDYAIEWQEWQSTQAFSMVELIQWYDVWYALAVKYDLVEEFTENCII